MASYLNGLSERDVMTLAGIIGDDPTRLLGRLHSRPWSIHDLLGDPSVFETITDGHSHPTTVVSPFLLFAVLVHRVADDLRDATHVNDWCGPRSRLPVFDVAPLQEFLEDPGRLFFLVTLLASFAVPEPPPVPAKPFDLSDMASWLDSAIPSDRTKLLRRLGDLALLTAGVFPDSTGAKPLAPPEAKRLGGTVGMTADELLRLCDYGHMAPGLEALDSLGARWYGAAVIDSGTPPVLADIASRFRAARRVLNHLTDSYLYRIHPNWNLAA